MHAVELSKTYDPKEFEDRIYSFWLSKKLFSPIENGKEPFVIVIPPPNVTGVLHMGHGLNISLQDILIRYYRMLGRPTLWVPGTDHAGIATQNVVEKRLKKKGLSRFDLGREKFLEETWKVKEEHHAIIVKQLQKIGASCDWTRERFTLDEGLSRAVREVFVRLYEKGLVYRGNYLVNWCPSCGTALADDEVEHKEVAGKLYHIYYPLEDGSGRVEIATTRPETLLGDTAVAVNPEDPRYTHLVGKKVILPLANRVIPVIADDYVDKEFGTGVVKITPAHDPNDYEVSERHGLPKINILTPDGRLNDNVSERFRGLDVNTARERVVEELTASGLFIRAEEHTHQVGHCYRCSTVIEPYLSTQWFVKMRGMAEKALDAWKRDQIRFYPKRWENTYTHWLSNIRDWCISRQLWWGHRIPAWYCDECGEMMVLREAPERCTRCGSFAIRQDDDVLDTWFSSWLWPFSTLGWPDDTHDLSTFFPTTTLVTGYDIIFFWVARMIMASLEFTGQVPFRDIYITGLVRDKQGRKMSKSLGNGMDPLEIVEEFGADSLKFTLCFLAAQGQDVLVDKESFKFGSKFANKIWNASRYLLMNLEGKTIIPFEDIELTDVDRWIFHCLNEAVKRVRDAVPQYRFNEAAQAVYEFFWNDFCDWYIESSKLSLYSDDQKEQDRAISLLVYVLEESLRLLHPFLSFITEEIYQKLPVHGESIINAAYPSVVAERENREIASMFGSVQELIRSVRTVRSEFTIPPEKKIRVTVKTDPGFSAAGFFASQRAVIESLAGIGELSFTEVKSEGSGSIAIPGNGFEAFLFVRDVIDVPKQLEKLKKESVNLEKLIAQTKGKLSNEQFLSHAPEEIVAKEKGKLAEFSERKGKIATYIAELSR